jgi:hypothetical protein
MDDLLEGAAGALRDLLEVAVAAFVAVSTQFVDAVASIVHGFIESRRDER